MKTKKIVDNLRDFISEERVRLKQMSKVIDTIHELVAVLPVRIGNYELVLTRRISGPQTSVLTYMSQDDSYNIYIFIANEDDIEVQAGTKIKRIEGKHKCTWSEMSYEIQDEVIGFIEAWQTKSKPDETR